MTRLYTVDSKKPSAIGHFDWATLVFAIGQEYSDRDGRTVETVIQDTLDKLLLGDLEFMPMKSGLSTYDMGEVAGNNSIIVSWYLPDDYGKLSDEHTTWTLQLSGDGIATWEQIARNHGSHISKLFKLARDLGAHETRIDACLNLFNYPKEYSARYAYEQANVGNLITSARSVTAEKHFASTGGIKGDDAYQGPQEGFTCYIGSRHSPQLLRIYNKLAERSDKVNLLYPVNSWSRWEFELHDEKAQGFMDAYFDNDCDFAKTWIEYLAGFCRFIERVGHQAKRSRYPNATWFDLLINNAEKQIKIRTENQKPTFERSAQWIQKQVLPTITAMYAARRAKYIKNGVNFEDAGRLALEKIHNDIKEQIAIGKVNWGAVSTWLEEHFDDID